MKRRYASHYFYFLPHNRVYRNAVIEIGENKMLSVFPLQQEIESTLWIPGIVLLLDPLSYDSLQKKQPQLWSTIEEKMPDTSPWHRFGYVCKEEDIICAISPFSPGSRKNGIDFITEQILF